MLSDYVHQIPVRTLKNTSAIQAVRHDSLGSCGIVFYKAGQVEVTTNMSLKVNQPYCSR